MHTMRASTYAPDLSCPLRDPRLGAILDELPELDPTRFQDMGQLGVGGSGEVRRVWDRVLGRSLAIKILRADLNVPALLGRFLAEARLTARLDHPSVVPIYDIGRLPDGRLGFTMQEVRGPTMGALIRERRWGLRRLVGLLRDVCEAAAYAHEQGVIHRDLKPDNVAVHPRGFPLVLDWGIAALRSSPEGVSGTPTYMAPEQARGEPADARSDVYALGAILYEVLSGDPPWDDAPAAILWRLRAGHRPWALPQSAPSALREICERAMAARPAQRFVCARRMGDALSRWLEA